MPRGYPNPPKPRPPSPHPHKVAYVVEHCVALLKGLPNRRDRAIAIGGIIAGLIHTNHLDGVMNVINEATNAVNHYEHGVIDEPGRSY